MLRPIPPDILARIEAHEQWLRTSQEKGQQLFDGDLDLHDLDLSERNLMMCIVPDANMNGALLRNTYMSYSNLCGVSFVDAILDGAWIVKTDAWEANFTNVHMHNAHCIRLDLQKANLQHADLIGTTFYNADFDSANLEYTNFSNTDLRYAYFYGAKMEHAILTGASVWDIALAGATGIESVVADWIDISEDPENAPQRLEGEQARQWLLAQAARPLPTWWKPS
jgi:uncharacterized protein YjbI with pentapeptide repeats